MKFQNGFDSLNILLRYDCKDNQKHSKASATTKLLPPINIRSSDLASSKAALMADSTLPNVFPCSPKAEPFFASSFSSKALAICAFVN